MASFRDTRTSSVGVVLLEHRGVALRAAITPCFWRILLLSPGTLGTCSLHGLSAGLWRPEEVEGRALLLHEPRRAATSLTIALGSP